MADGTLSVDIAVDLSSLEEGLQAAIDTLTAAYERFFEAGSSLVDALSEGVRGNPGLSDAAQQAVWQARDTASSAIQGAGFQALGQGIPQGMAQGVYAGTGALTAAVSAMVQQALAAARAALDAHSPSRAFEAVGNDAMDGFLLPFEQARVQNPLSGAFTAMVKGAKAELSQGTNSTQNITIEHIEIQTPALTTPSDWAAAGRRMGEAFQQAVRYKGVFLGA